MQLYSFFRAIQYVERDGIEKYHTLDCYPPDLEKKIELLAYFRSYLKGSVIKVEDCHSVLTISHCYHFLILFLFVQAEF